MRLIDADAFKEYCLNGLIEMEPELRAVGKYDFAIKLTKELLKDVDEQPTIEVQTFIHAGWLMPDKNYSDKIWRKCSNCNTHIEKYSKYVSFMGSTNYFENTLNFCPICGARMDLEAADGNE